MSEEHQNLKIKDLVFFKQDGSDTGVLKISPLPEYVINEKRFDNMQGAQSLNLIIGANNSGKSRFIRSLLKLDFRLITNITWEELGNNIEELNSLMVSTGAGDINRYLNIIDLNKAIILSDLTPLIEQPGRLSEEQGIRASELYEKIKNTEYLKLNNSIYIPALRTAHTLYDEEDNPINRDFYSQTLIKNYPEIQNIKSTYSAAPVDIDVFTGINLYEEIREARNSIREIRKRFEKFETFLSKNIFDGKEVDVVAIDEEGSRRINIHIEGSESNKDIHELGDGIQAIIILMYKIFMADENTLIVIDEPEQHLHPGLQRVFIDTTLRLLKERNNNTVIFIVTHSNHLMDLTIPQEDVSIYSFSKNKNDENSPVNVRACKAGDYSLLSELGVNSSSAFIANTSIWVEGPTDRKYLKFFLLKYLEKNATEAESIKLKEDIDFAFYEYGGSLLSHYDFNSNEPENLEQLEKIKAFSLANRIFLLADKDATSSKGIDEKSKRLLKLEEIAKTSDNFLFKKTTGIEIENILPESIYKKYIHTLYKGNPSSKVKENIEAKVCSYKDQKIGGFLQSIISGRSGIKSIKKFKSTGGGLNTSYKNSLCDYVIDNFDKTEYSKIVKSGSSLDILIKSLYKFIVN